MSGHINSLHYNGRATAVAQSSALSRAMVNSAGSSRGPRWKAVPQPPFVPKGLSVRAQCPRIAFNFISSQIPGVRLAELAARSSHGLDQMIAGGAERIFGTTPKQLCFNVMWPGYAHIQTWAFTIDTVSCRGPITRSELGMALSQQFSRFIEFMKSQHCTNPEWMIGATGITFDRLVLLAVINTCEDFWQAEVAYMC
ncbi:hypothetical protein HGRIS_010358 [Hohenbuehelia grisea]|uniref:Uncharacterized protein n=1 Tax=Hohenbuehelia grisea TaxID=104357 RepID=A0ABR3J4M5_9AGAR